MLHKNKILINQKKCIFAFGRFISEVNPASRNKLRRGGPLDRFCYFKIWVKLIAFIELSIGLSTLATLIVYSSLSISDKSLNVFIFVCTTSTISLLIGLGLLAENDMARKILVLFSGYIVLTKILIFVELMQFNGEILTFIPTGLKNLVSVFYHFLLVVLLYRIKLQK